MYVKMEVESFWWLEDNCWSGALDRLKEMGIKEEDEISMCELFDQYTRRGISEKEAEEQMKLYW